MTRRVVSERSRMATVPFNPFGELGRAYELLVHKLPALVAELNGRVEREAGGLILIKEFCYG